MKRIVLVLLCIIFLLSAVACGKTEDSNNIGKGNSGKPSQDSSEATSSPYKDIINKYVEFLTIKDNTKTLPKPDPWADDITVALYELVNAYVNDPSSMGYATKDINRDGVDELILLDKGNKIYTLFTVEKNSPVLLLTYDATTIVISSDGTVYTRKKLGDSVYSYQTTIEKIVDGKLEGMEYCAVMSGNSMSYYKKENGEQIEITKQENDMLNESIYGIMLSPTNYNKITGFRFIPAIDDNSSQSSAPIADFSSYENIVSAYRKIVKCFSEYNVSNWINGEFDSLFTFKDNESYDMFNSIFYNGICFKPTKENFSSQYADDGDNAYGYAKKDLNRDGVDELILLNDSYEIIALFTMKDGKPVFLREAIGALIDENGHIHVSITTGGVVSRDGELYIYEVNNSGIECVVGVGYKVNVYLQKEGWYRIENGVKTPITDEEGNALYAQCCVDGGYSEEEYTRNFSGIEFVPLFKRTLASRNNLHKYSNMSFVNGNTLEVSAVYENKIEFIFECAYNAPEESTTYRTQISGEAILENNKYYFELDGVKGYIDFGVTVVWLTVTESQNEHVECRAYLFDYIE